MSAHLLIYSLFFKLSLGLGLDLEFGYRVNINAKIRDRVRVWVGFSVEIRTNIAIFLFLRNVTAASVLFFSESVQRIFLKFSSAPQVRNIKKFENHCIKDYGLWLLQRDC